MRSPSDRDVLAGSDLFAHLPAEALAELAGQVARRSLVADEVLCEMGSPGTSAFIIVSGRLQIAAGERVLGHAGRGELIGEISLLTGEPRSATVRALRDSEVLEIDAAVFDEVLASHSACYRSVSRTLVERLHRMVTDVPGSAQATVVTLLDDGRSASRRARLDLIDRLGPAVAVVVDQNLDLASLETTHELVVIAPGVDDGGHGGDQDDEFASFAVRHSDQVVFFVDASSPVGVVPAVLTDRGDSDRRSVNGSHAHRHELVLVHPAESRLPTNTATWLDHHEPIHHHHVRSGDVAHLDRVIRWIRREPYVLVLSGGGVRGLAHGGLYRALVEVGVPVDVVVGVSAGAVAGAVMAMGHDPETCIELGKEFFGARGSPVDFTVPTVALGSGRRINGWLKEMVGAQTRQEDLWLPTVFVSANLSTVDLYLHWMGPLWRALRATTAIPGVFPPVAEPGGVLVDGGLVANLPIDLARNLFPGAVILASDVGRRLELDPGRFPAEAEISGWRAGLSRFRRGGRVPGMVRIMAQLTALGGLGIPEGEGDLHIDFDLDEFGLFDFKQAPRIAEVGYERSLPLVAAWVREQA